MSPMTVAARAAARAGVRTFQTSAVRANTAALPASKPFGAVRSGLVGFLAGTVAAGSGSYSFLTREFKTQNDALLEDLYVRACI